MDLLKKVYDGEISTDDAYGLLEPGGETQSHDQLGISDIEATALLYGVSIDDIARWRYQGWPEKCAICGSKLSRLDEGGWCTAYSTQHAAIRLVHAECLPEDKE